MCSSNRSDGTYRGGDVDPGVSRRHTAPEGIERESPEQRAGHLVAAADGIAEVGDQRVHEDRVLFAINNQQTDKPTGRTPADRVVAVEKEEKKKKTTTTVCVV